MAARTSVRPAAALADPPLSRMLQDSYPASVKEIHVSEIPGGRYWGRQYGYIIDRNDTLITDLSLTFTGGERHDALKHLMLPAQTRLRGKVAVINTYFSSNFHHWLLDTLPRFEWIRRAGHHWSEIDHFILPGVLSRWHFATLEQLGIPQQKIVRSSTNLHVQADLLLVPSHSTPDAQPEQYDYPPEGLQFTRKIFLENNPALMADTPKRILVSRERANVRRLVQGERAARFLAGMGFKKVLLEDYSLLEQAAMFHKADCVVMPTGGNLANFVFCRPGTIAMELFSCSYVPDFTHAMMGEIGLRYYALVADKRAPLVHGDHGSNEDIDFDPCRLEAIVRKALS